MEEVFIKKPFVLREQLLSKNLIDHRFERRVFIEFQYLASFDKFIKGLPNFGILAYSFGKA
jgi:hypothetical protein